jgi:hypothetical protein
MVNAQETSRPADDGVRWWRAFPGEAGQLEVLRRWIEDLLPSCPARDDVTAVACELAANAVCHTLSGDGGQFGVRITLEADLVTIAVADGGGTTEPGAGRGSAGRAWAGAADRARAIGGHHCDRRCPRADRSGQRALVGR